MFMATRFYKVKHPNGISVKKSGDLYRIHGFEVFKKNAKS
ncbi:hypothetical protein J2W95_000021 [Flavobacterium granuli]|uniref:Uncharacterized protein n=1 Tax=Flavobacterium granuli TaxID=280093 RepID=A0ABU1RX47_9FLAO|nr:hypothetical protein [Flavobacterium granuli]